ncbi:MAG: hypothetical protein ACXVP5_08875 [Tumebacillaceae bacterium]
MKLVKKITLVASTLSTLAIALIPTSVLAANSDAKYWFQNVGYASTMGRVGWYTSGAPSTMDDLGFSTAIVSSASVFTPSNNLGFERGRIWSRPTYVKSYMGASAYFTSDVSTIKTVLQFQNTNGDSNLWIDGSDPVQSDSSQIKIPAYAYTLANVIDKTGGIVGDVMSYIDGFTYASTTVSWPNNNRQESYIEMFNINGLSGVALDPAYTYKEGDYASRGTYAGSSAKWSFHLVNPSATYYNVNVVGRVMYMTWNQDMYGNGWYNYAWSGLAQAPHQINKY